MNSLIPPVPAVLWHYTDEKFGHPGILGTGVIQPGLDGLVWMTDLAEPNREAIGLTRVSVMVGLDRGARRYRVNEVQTSVPWLQFRSLLDRGDWADQIDELEGYPGSLPRHWFVSWKPVPAVYDPIKSK